MGKKSIVYLIDNLINNKIYIGKHSTTIPHDMKNYWGSSELLNNAIEKYGKENFKRYTLFIYKTEEEAYQKEAEIVDENFIGRKDTYNCRTGGDGSYICSEETKKKMSETKTGKNNPQFGKRGEKSPNYGRIFSEEHRRNISKNSPDRSGVNNPNWGKTHSEKTKKKMSEKTKGENHPLHGKHLTEETKKKISISNKGKVRSEESCKRISDSKSGENHPFFGKHLSDSHKRNISEANKGTNGYWYGKQFSEEHRRKIGEKGKLPLELIKQRRLDVKNANRIYGYKTKLGKQWGIGKSSAGKFIKRYASDLI